jgi:hypothetical protein
MTTPMSQDVQELFRLVGKAVWMLQHLENFVATFTAMIILQKRRDKSKNVTEEFANKTLEKQKKLTLGVMILNAKREKSIPPFLHERFNNFLKERNWLIHSCMQTDHLSLRSEKNKLHLFGRLEEFSEEAIDLRKELQNLMNTWSSEKGYDLNLAIEKAEKLIREASKS